jgi:NAD(P)-dependent dehydrogenase (short-subunit alcohol dehydrogenase family)
LPHHRFLTLGTVIVPGGPWEQAHRNFRCALAGRPILHDDPVSIDTGPVLVLGGRSEIGTAVAERLAARGCTTVVLAARRSADLAEEEAALLRAGATTVGRVEFDADDLAGQAAALDDAFERFGTPSTVVVAFGVLGDQAVAELDVAAAVAVVHTDYVAQVHVLTVLAERLRTEGRGTLVVFSSVAGVRVRRANYVYGSAKAGLDGFASGLADALVGSGVRLLLVRPGFVVGGMTAGMTPAPFSSTPAQVADAVVDALAGSRREVWVPEILRPIFFVMRLLPRAVWRRMPR